MTSQAPLSPTVVTQLLPEKGQVLLKGLYLRQDLARMAAQIGRSLVLTNYLADRNAVIAKAAGDHHFQVPLELRNPSDWHLFQELMAQADVVISGSAYLERVTTLGSRAEDVLLQFEAGGEFENLGQWRLDAGYGKRSPDMAILSHRLEFPFPPGLLGTGRKVMVFTSYAEADTKEARALTASGVDVIGSGPAGVEGKQLIDTLGEGMGYRVIMMATGPSVLDLLLEAERPDLLYITEAQVEIPFDDPSKVKRLLPGGRKVDALSEFRLSHRYVQQDAVTEDGSLISQEFRRYDRRSLRLE